MAWLYRTSTFAAMRHGRLAAAVAAAGVLSAPAAAPAATLEPLKPCYVSATKAQREQVALAGSGFTPGAVLDVALDGKVVGTATADASGALGGQAVRAPFVARGSRAFRVTVAERDDPSSAVELRARVTALVAELVPAPRLPRQRVRWRGRGFTGTGPLFVHYVRKGRHHRTVRLGRASGPCGAFAVEARQFPFRPGTGRWVVRIDQQRRYAQVPRGIFWAFDIRVRRAG
jgi:hypothetical protein